MDEISLPEGIAPIKLDSASDLSGWRVNTPLCQALISRQGAQVLEFQARDKQPLLWLSEKASYIPGKAIRGGIPLCFPWFGPHPEKPDKPAHGFARNRDWHLKKAERWHDIVTLHFQLDADAKTHALWPHEFETTLVIILGTMLELQLIVKNTGHNPFDFSFAFHSYFPVNHIGHVCVTGLENTTFIDQLHPRQPLQQQQGLLRFSSETDRIYLDASGHYRLLDEKAGRVLRISAPDCRSAIAWNPWREKTGRLGDMAPDAWQGMVCVECGNVAGDRITLLPGAAKNFALRLESDI